MEPDRQCWVRFQLRVGVYDQSPCGHIFWTDIPKGTGANSQGLGHMTTLSLCVNADLERI